MYVLGGIFELISDSFESIASINLKIVGGDAYLSSF
jgi:hypothetical protein